MHDQALVWTTDSKLQVTSLTARLRDLAEIGSSTAALHVSDLWGQSDPFAVAVVAHHWALDGESLCFEAPIHGATYRFQIQPLHDVSGAVIGACGSASEVTDPNPLDANALRHIERSVGLGTWYEDLRTGLVSVSEGLAGLLGAQRQSAKVDIRAFDHPDDRAHIARTIDESIDGSYTCDHRILCARGRVRTVRERLRVINDERGVAVARVGTMVDISDLKEREAQLSELALHDSLTHLPNRASLEERLASTIERCRRNNRRCAALFIDLDRFKTVNDAHGHGFGDRVLACVAERLTGHVRSNDTVARLGGDEFIVLIDDLFTDEAGLDAGRKILRSFDEPFAIDNRTVAVSASIGVATYPRFGATQQDLLAAADHAMYAVKRSGGNGVKLAATGEESATRTTEKAACLAHSSPAPHLSGTLESV